MERTKLEEFKTLHEMHELLAYFSSHREEFPDEHVHLRRGIAKVLLEEYAPLLMLAQHLGAAGAKLTASAYEGPDGYLYFEDGAEAAVQVTCAGESDQTAYKRELLASGRLVFDSQRVERVSVSKAFRVSGRVLSTKDRGTSLAVEEIRLALQKKCKNFKEGTSILLIHSRRNELTMSADWTAQVHAAMSHLSEVPYRAVFVCTRKSIFKIPTA